MDLQCYRNFIAIVEEGSLTAASQRLHIAQPALSNQLKAMEREYGASLLIRGARRVSLTDGGRILFEKAKHMVALEASAKKEVLDCARGVAGTLRLGITFSNSVSFLDGMLLEYQRKNPQVKYQLYETETSKILDLLRRGIVEIGIARSPFQASSELEFLQERPEHFVAVFRKGDDWFSGRKGPIPIAALAQVPLCIIRRFEPMFSLACQRSSFTPNLVCVNTQLASSILWVREGLAVAVVPRSSFQYLGDDSLECLPIDEPMLETSRAIITVKGRYLSAVAQAFLKVCLTSMELEDTP